MEIILIMKRNSLIIYFESKSEIYEVYSKIPFDKALYPAIFLKDRHDSVEIMNYKNEYNNNNKLNNMINKIKKINFQNIFL